ncbi:MAG: 30S ribosomal protein S3 [Phototrophicaceae bacterium]|jgi:small subunit ribosomal protein S3
MGRKVHPIGFRLKINRDWDSRWYAEGRDYVDLIHEDRMIRTMIRTITGKQAGVARIEIERFPGQIVAHIHTARPGIVIGRKGDSVKKLRVDMERKTGKKVKIEVVEIDKPDIEPVLVAESIADQIERRIGHSRAIKRAIGQAMRQGAKGIRIEVSGRLAGGDMARREWQSEGRIPRNTLRAQVEFGRAEALTTFGRIGIKVWVYRGDVLTRQQLEQQSNRKATVEDGSSTSGAGR